VSKRSAATVEQVLPFEKKVFELQEAVEKAETDEDREKLQAELVHEQEHLFDNISAWERVQLARHPQRPRMLDFTSRIFEDFIELHGDRAVGDDPAMVCGIARFRGETLFVVGQQKGVSTDEKVLRNFGMAHPEGYRKAIRMFHLAERLGYPVVSFVDTPAAHPGIEAERFGQGPAIASNMYACLQLKMPLMAAVLSEGGSGGALGIAVGDWVAMFENAMYVICPPERCAEILWRDVEKKEMAASAMRISAKELKELGAIDTILPEPNGGAHRDPNSAATVLAEEIARFLEQARRGAWSVERRRKKFLSMGQYIELALEPQVEGLDEAAGAH